MNEEEGAATVSAATYNTTTPPLLGPTTAATTSSSSSTTNQQHDAANPAKDLVTVSAQCYQNYKSALRWWHAYSCESMDKVGYPWSGELDSALKSAVASYKRDVGVKKRNGIMKQKEGG